MEFLWKRLPFWSHFVAFWVSFFHFLRIWASLWWWREARVWTKCNKEEKQSKKESQNETLLIRNLCFFQLLFYWFLEQSWEVFFSALVAEVSQMRATWGHFSSHVAATLESWKLWFRLHQTLLFRVLRGWVKTFWPTFFKFFSEKGLEALFFTIFWEFEGPAVAPKTTFGEHFRYTFCVDFLCILKGKPNLKPGKGRRRLGGSWGPKPFIYWPLKADIQSEASWKMNADKQQKT